MIGAQAWSWGATSMLEEGHPVCALCGWASCAAHVPAVPPVYGGCTPRLSAPVVVLVYSHDMYGHIGLLLDHLLNEVELQLSWELLLERG